MLLFRYVFGSNRGRNGKSQFCADLAVIVVSRLGNVSYGNIGSALSAQDFRRRLTCGRAYVDIVNRSACRTADLYLLDFRAENRDFLFVGNRKNVGFKLSYNRIVKQIYKAVNTSADKLIGFSVDFVNFRNGGIEYLHYLILSGGFF